MKNKSFLSLSLFALIVSHLALIPVFSLYGVSICPVLQEMGFWRICQMNLIFIAFLLCLTLASSVILAQVFIARWNQQGLEASVSPFRFAVFSLYSFSFSLSSFLFIYYLNKIAVPAPSLSRLTTALFYSGVFLLILTLQISDTLALHWLRNQRERIQEDPSQNQAPLAKPDHLLSKWIGTSLWNSLPESGALLIGGSIFYQSLSKNYPKAESYFLLKISLLLFAWVILNRFFKAIKDFRLLKDVKAHLAALGRLDPHYFSMTKAAGYWESIFQALNQTTHLIQQRTRLAKGFAAYVALDVVEQFMSFTGEQKKGSLLSLTLISSDLRDFTQMAARHPPEKVVETLNIYFEDMIEILIMKRVLLDKFIGDGILAYVDPEIKSADEAACLAVSAALAMREGLTLTNQKLQIQNLPSLKMGVAVHAGKVILGNIGSSRRMQYTIIGDTVNLTCRLETLCKILGAEIIISQPVWDALTPELQAPFTDLGKHAVRGIREPIQIYGMLASESVKEKKLA